MKDKGIAFIQKQIMKTSFDDESYKILTQIW